MRKQRFVHTKGLGKMRTRNAFKSGGAGDSVKALSANELRAGIPISSRSVSLDVLPRVEGEAQPLSTTDEVFATHQLGVLTEFEDFDSGG